MKRCPECRRDYYDDTLSFCLNDGTELVYGLEPDEPATAILSEPGSYSPPALGGVAEGRGGSATGFPASESPTRVQINSTDQTAILPRAREAEPQESLGGISEKRSFSANRAAKPLVGVAVAAVILIGGFFGYRYFAPTKQINSIAVMPFVNDSGNADSEYLSDGMAETLIGSLSQLPNLSVKSRSLAFQYKGKDDLKKIGRDLNVQAILNGRVSQRGEQLILSLELVDVDTGNVVWTEQYDRKQADIITLQKDIARDVSNKLRIKLTVPDEQRLVKSYTENADAYHFYLKGTFCWNKQTESAYREATGYFNQAIEKDPNYALAYSGLANTYVALGIDYAKPKDTFPVAKLYARKALDLAPELAEAHAAMGAINFFYDWDWAAADRELKHVVELNPESAEPFACTLHYLDSAGQPDDAVAEVKRIAAQHPTSVVISAEIGCSSYYAHRYDEAIVDLQKTIEMDADFWPAYYNLGRAYGQKKMYKEAIAAVTKANTLSEGTPYVIAELGYINAVSGNKPAAMNALHNLEKEETSKYIDVYLKAIIYSGLGDKEKALIELEKALQNHSTWIIWIKVEPKFESLHSDPRFQDILRRIGLS